MLKYAVILLDKTSVAYCHAENPYSERELIPLQVLKDAILWAMKENLMIQFVYPKYELPKEYLDVIDSIDHVDISSDICADIVVLDGFDTDAEIEGKNIVVRTTLDDLIAQKEPLLSILRRAAHLSLIIFDIEKLDSEAIKNYKDFLEEVVSDVVEMYKEGYSPQINILTDRLLLDSMNNCNAGSEAITVGPNGRFYICPAFYYDDEADCVGSLASGPDIKNHRLYQLSHAPICRICDAYQCHRCIWLNRKTTYEVNTPSREQCVVAHIERNASRDLLDAVRKHGDFLPDKEIPEIEYIDPFDKIER